MASNGEGTASSSSPQNARTEGDKSPNIQQSGRGPEVTQIGLFNVASEVRGPEAAPTAALPPPPASAPPTITVPPPAAAQPPSEPPAVWASTERENWEWLEFGVSLAASFFSLLTSALAFAKLGAGGVAWVALPLLVLVLVVHFFVAFQVWVCAGEGDRLRAQQLLRIDAPLLFAASAVPIGAVLAGYVSVAGFGVSAGDRALVVSAGGLPWLAIVLNWAAVRTIPPERIRRTSFRSITKALKALDKQISLIVAKRVCALDNPPLKWGDNERQDKLDKLADDYEAAHAAERSHPIEQAQRAGIVRLEEQALEYVRSYGYAADELMRKLRAGLRAEYTKGSQAGSELQTLVALYLKKPYNMVDQDIESLAQRHRRLNGWVV